jgi:pimeloyl-ACP methyl ester carboxylesterase
MDSRGSIWHSLCQNASAEQANPLAATQRPIALRCIEEKAPRPTWKTKPSWYVVAEEDRMINPATQFFLARRMGEDIRSEKVDHTPLVTASDVVMASVLQAIDRIRVSE